MNYGPWLDEQGFPGCRQQDGSWDGGDTAAIMGTIMALSPALTELVIKPLPEDMPYDLFYQQPLRHPDRKKWYGQPWRYSRDQLTAMLAGRILSGMPSTNLWRAHRKRLCLTAWNTLNNDGSAKSWPASMGDICGPEIWALWIRYHSPWWGWLVLWFLDLQTLIGAIQWRWFTPETFQISRNHMLVSIVARRRMPSLVSLVIYYWINDWTDLIQRWRLSNTATGEFPTADLFNAAVNGSPG